VSWGGKASFANVSTAILYTFESQLVYVSTHFLNNFCVYPHTVIVDPQVER
jgi:hypothetical protein